MKNASKATALFSAALLLSSAGVASAQSGHAWFGCTFSDSVGGKNRVFYSTVFLGEISPTRVGKREIEKEANVHPYAIRFKQYLNAKYPDLTKDPVNEWNPAQCTFSDESSAGKIEIEQHLKHLQDVAPQVGKTPIITSWPAQNFPSK